jgi:hypothetical protein
MSTTTLRRTGNTPYKVDDEQHKLLFDDDNGTSGPNGKRWHWLRIFGGKDPAYLISIEYRSEFEPEHCAVFESANLNDLIEALQKYDPTKYAIGLPARTDAELAKTGGRNRQIYEDLKGRWDQLVSNAAENLGIAPVTSAKAEKPKVAVSVLFTETMLADIDSLRGNLSREDFVLLATETLIQSKK